MTKMARFEVLWSKSTGEVTQIEENENPSDAERGWPHLSKLSAESQMMRTVPSDEMSSTGNESREWEWGNQ